MTEARHGKGKRYFSRRDQLDLFNAVESPVWVFDVDAHRVWWGNAAAVRFWRAENLDDLLSRDFSSDSDMVQRRLRQVIDHTAPDSFASETWTLYPLGQPLTILLSMTPVKVDDEARDAVLIQASAPVQMPNDPQGLRLLEAMRCTSLIVSTFTLDGEFLSHNTAAAEAYGRDPLQELDQEPDFLDRFEDEEEGRLILAAARASTECHGEYRMRTLGGARWHSVDVALGRDPLSGDGTLIVTEEDITETRRAQEELEELNRTLEQRVRDRTEDLRAAILEAENANRAKSDFLARMSHDLRTPLNAVLGFSEIIRDGLVREDDMARVQDYAGSIFDAAQLLLEMINDLLDVSRIEAGKIEINAQPVDLRQLMANTVGLVRSGRQGGDAPIHVDVSGDQPVVTTDERLLKQICLNLLSNAAKYTPLDGRIDLTVTVDGAADTARITVADTGVGMPAAMLETVFDPYERGPSEVASKQHGSGLGLAIVKGLVEILGGTVSVDSEVGKGTTLIVDVPTDGGGAAVQDVA